MSWKVFPRIYTNLQSSPTACNFTIGDPYMLFYEKWEIIIEMFDSWKIQNTSIFYFWKKSPKNSQIFQLFTLYSKGRHFNITKLEILIFCNILHLEIDFVIWAEKGYFLHKTLEKSFVKNTINEKNGIAYSTAHNLKTVYLWNFHFR